MTGRACMGNRGPINTAWVALPLPVLILFASYSEGDENARQSRTEGEQMVRAEMPLPEPGLTYEAAERIGEREA